MKSIAFSTFAAHLAVAAASSPFQGTRLRGNQAQDARNLDTCSGPSEICAFEEKAAIKPTSIESGFNPLDPDSPSTWDLSCSGIPMYEAGNPDGTKEEASIAYLNWECSTSTLCILVKANEGFYLVDSEDDMWFKNYVEGQDVLTPLNGLKKTRNEFGQIISWEACYDILSDCTAEGVEIHANYKRVLQDGIDPDSRTTSTGKKGPGYISLDLTCPCAENSDDCQINDCYAPSQCVEYPFTDDSGGSEFVCEYDVVYPNCCITDDDCGDNLVCGDLATAPVGIGKCKVDDGDGSTGTTPTGVSSVTTDPPSTSECEVDGDCGNVDVATLLQSGGSAECAVAVCSDKSCAASPKPEPDVCATPVDFDDIGNSCYEAHVCTGINCVATYKSVDASCTGPEQDITCQKWKCLKPVGETGSRTTCQAVNTEAGTLCSAVGAQDGRGPCDSGNKCNGAGVCSDVDIAGNPVSYQDNTFECKQSTDLCDAPEYCTGDKYTCPEDKNYGDVGVIGRGGVPVTADEVCRDACDDGACLDDIAEVCPGGTKKCPEDVIFSKKLDIIAAQHYNAGSTHITATDNDNGEVEVCITTKLNEDWTLKNRVDSIKMEINGVQAPPSSPGRYTYKDLAQKYYDATGVTTCYPFIPSTSSTIYFALHVDVKEISSGNTETAWPMVPPLGETETATATSLSPQPFVKSGTNSGPKIKSKVTSASTTEDGDGKTIGWGSYYTFSIGCANVDTCDITPAASTTTTTGTTVAPGSSTTTTAAHATFTCTGSDSTPLTCKHRTDEAFGCENLFE